MESIIELLRSNGVKATSQRVWTYHVLHEASTHLSVDEVYKAVKAHVPAISRATVYSILELFRAKELIKDIKIDFERAFYETRTDGHHHFRCKLCKRIWDIDICLCPTLEKKDVDGHTIQDFHGYFYGICCECKKAQGEAIKEECHG